MELLKFFFGLLLLLAPIAIWIYVARIYDLLKRMEKNQEKLLEREGMSDERND